MSSSIDPQSPRQAFIRSVYRTGPSPDKPTGTKMVDTPFGSNAPSMSTGDEAVKAILGRAFAS